MSDTPYATLEHMLVETTTGWLGWMGSTYWWADAVVQCTSAVGPAYARGGILVTAAEVDAMVTSDA